MKKFVDYLDQKVELLKNDKILLMIFLLHIVLTVCHICHSFLSDIQYHAYMRAGCCLLIAILIFFFGRIGLSYGFVIYACILAYFNTFYNYGSIFFTLIAIGANPKMKKCFIGVLLLNVIISFSLQRLIVFSFAIQVIYFALYYLCTKYVFTVHGPDKLNLTEDEKIILDELLSGKKQKEIEQYSQPTITHKLKNARERNLIETTAELLTKYAAEKEK